MSFSLLTSKDTRQPFRKRHPVLTPLLVVLLILIIIGFTGKVNTSPSIGVVNIEGVILQSEPVIKALRELEKNPLIKGIILRINSQGGGVVPSQEIYTELKRLRKDKVIYTSIASVAASGGYYVAIGSDRIYASPGSITGSIGVIMQSFNVGDLISKVGIKVNTIKSGKNKDIGSTYRTMSDEEYKLLEGVIQDTHRQFKEAVQQNRSIGTEKISEVTDGRIFSGAQALELDLIDGLASFREVIDIMKKDLGLSGNVKLIYPQNDDSTWKKISDLRSLIPFKGESTLSGLFYLNRSLGH